MSIVATVLGLVLINTLAFAGEFLAYGTWYSGGQPAGLYDNEPGERPRLRRGANLNGLLYSIHINEDGFRGAPLQHPPPDNAFRIWCVGGSTTFDIYAPSDAQAWPAVAGEVVAQAHPERTVEVINAGIPGEILQGSLEDLQAQGRAIRPNVVVIYHGPNDLRQVMTRPEDFVEPMGMMPWLFIEPALVRVLSRVLQGSEHLNVQLPARTMNPNQRQQIRQRLMAIIEYTRSLGATPLLATHALRWPPGVQGEEARAQVAESMVLLQMDADSVVRVFAEYNQLVEELAEQQQLPLVDVRAVVGPEMENWGDATHFRAPGSRLAGEAIGDAIVALGLAERRR